MSSKKVVVLGAQVPFIRGGAERLNDCLVAAINAWLSNPVPCRQQTYAIDDGTLRGYDWDAIGEAVCEGSFRILKLPSFLLNAAAHINLKLSKWLDYSPMLSPGKARELQQSEWLCNNSQFRRATGWKPRLKLSEGARELFKSP